MNIIFTLKSSIFNFACSLTFSGRVLFHHQRHSNFFCFTTKLYHCVRLTYHRPVVMSNVSSCQPPPHDVSPQIMYPAFMTSAHGGVSPYHDDCPQRGYPLTITSAHRGDILLLWRRPSTWPHFSFAPTSHNHPLGVFISRPLQGWPTLAPSIHFTLLAPSFWWPVTSRFLEFLLATILNKLKGGAIRIILHPIYYLQKLANFTFLSVKMDLWWRDKWIVELAFVFYMKFGGDQSPWGDFMAAFRQAVCSAFGLSTQMFQGTKQRQHYQSIIQGRRGLLSYKIFINA